MKSGLTNGRKMMTDGRTERRIVCSTVCKVLIWYELIAEFCSDVLLLIHMYSFSDTTDPWIFTGSHAYFGWRRDTQDDSMDFWANENA